MLPDEASSHDNTTLTNSLPIRALVCKAADVPQNGLKECAVEGGLKLVVANADGEFFGYQAMCPHQDVPLCEALFDGSTLTCHMHLWQWDIRTGAALGIAEAPLQRRLALTATRSNLEGEATALDVGEIFNGIAAGAREALEKIASREECRGSVPTGRATRRGLLVLESGRVEFETARRQGQSRGIHAEEGRGIRLGGAAGEPTQRSPGARLEKSVLLRINGKQALKVLESDPASGHVVMRRLAGLIARFLAAAGAR